MSEIPDCIIAAAGRSSRMNAWKPGLPWRNSTVLETVVQEAINAGCRVIVVAGRRYRRTFKLAGSMKKVTVVRARRWRKGMDESIRRGIQELKTKAFFVMPADMPLVQSETYRMLTREKSAAVVRPQFGGVLGHPVLFNSDARETIAAGKAGVPLRAVVGKLETNLVSWKDDSVVFDVDTPKEYELALKRETLGDKGRL